MRWTQLEMDVTVPDPWQQLTIDDVDMTPAPTLPLRLPSLFLEDAAPILDDATGYPADGRDPALVRLARVAAAIDAATEARDGSVTIDVDADMANIIGNEAEYRAEQARDRARECTFEKSEMMRMYGMARSHEATAKRAATIERQLTNPT